MASIDPRLQPQYSHPHAHRPPPSAQHQSPPAPALNPSAYASSNPPPRLPRIHPASDVQSSHPSHLASVQQPYYHPSSLSQQQPGPETSTTTPTQRYGSPHYHQEGHQDASNDGGVSPTEGNDANDPKRSRACESCRSLKVRCDQDPESPDAPCKRCAKAKRQCIITAPSRKRQKKTDSRVAELEKKIDALTGILNAQNQHGMTISEGNQSRHGPASMSSPESNHSYGSHNSRSAAWPSRDPQYHGRDSVDGSLQKRPLSTGPYDKQYQPQTGRSVVHIAPDQDDLDTMQHVASTLNTKVDEIIDERTAAQIFDRYIVEMTIHMPAVVFPSQTTAHQIRTTKPILFLSILVAASVGMMPMEPQEELTALLKGTLADCVIRYGGKSMELIQALILAVAWYRPPKRYDQMNFYQLTHIAAIMAVDIGLGKRMNLPKNSRPPTGSEQTTLMPKHLLNSSTVEARRTWLGCYFMCSNVAMTLRRPNLIRWSSYTEECVEVLETSDTTLPTDRLLCQFVRLQHINEEIGSQFSMDDPSATITISDSRVQYALKAFENQLKDWSSAASASPVWNAQLHYNEHVSSLYMHEVALHINHNVDDFRAPFTEESLRAASGQSIILSQAHSKALLECLASVHGMFQVFFSFELPTIRALPIFYFVRIAYGVVVLIKLFFAVTAPGSEVGKIITKEDLQVEHHLDTLLRIFHKIDEEQAFRPARMFLLILSKLRQWFRANKENKTIPRDASRFNPWAATQQAEDVIKEPRKSTGQHTPVSQKSEPTKPALQQQQPPRFNNSTPLHFLSDVATHSSNPNAQGLSSSSSPGAQLQGVSPAQQQPPQGAPPTSGYYGGTVAGAGALPQSGFDADAGDFHMGVGLEQAMDMTLGAADGDISNFFMGDPMFNFGPVPGDSMHYFQGWQ